MRRTRRLETEIGWLITQRSRYHCSAAPTEPTMAIVVPKAPGDPSGVTAKPVVVYSPLMNRNVSALSGSVRSRWKTNTLVAQQKTGNNRNCLDLRAANPLLTGRARDCPTSNGCRCLAALPHERQ